MAKSTVVVYQMGTISTRCCRLCSNVYSTTIKFSKLCPPCILKRKQEALAKAHKTMKQKDVKRVYALEEYLKTKMAYKSQKRWNKKHKQNLNTVTSSRNNE